MKKHIEKIAVAVFAAAVIVACTGSAYCGGQYHIQKAYAEPTFNEDRLAAYHDGVLYTLNCAGEKMLTYPYQEYGCEGAKDYFNNFILVRNDAVGVADEAINLYAYIITDEQKTLLYEYENGMTKAITKNQYNENLELFDSLCAELEEQLNAYYEQQYYAQQQYSSYGGGNDGYYVENGSGLTKSGGVNYYNGRRETWYSSNVLYHYRTSEWSVDSEGFYRDSNGNYIVAASDMPQGTVFEGSKGNCIVADSGCANGTTDYYTAF